MKYDQSLHYLNSFIDFERLRVQPSSRFMNLDRMRTLLDLFNHPEDVFFPILIAGTKGKGSTGFFLESVLKASHISVGFYSSPHLNSPRERIRIQGNWISKEAWSEVLSEIKSRLANHKKGNTFTYFEIMTLMAILAFKQSGIRVGIFEIGMGGRLDAANCLNAPLCILTPIHLDHEAFLGNTIRSIAKEKAAIIRPQSHVIMSTQKREGRKEIKRQALIKQATHHDAVSTNGSPIGLRSDVQKINAGTACKAAEILRDHFGFLIHSKTIQKGLRSNRWPGRYEMIPGKPRYLLDSAHNPSSVKALIRNLKKDHRDSKRILLFNVCKDKKSGLMLKDLSTYFSEVVLVAVDHPRMKSLESLAREAQGWFRHVWMAQTVKRAARLAEKRASDSGWVVGTGSFYLVGALREHLKDRIQQRVSR